MLRTEYQTRNTRTSYILFLHTHFLLFTFYRFVQNTLQYPAGKKIFNLHQLVMQNKALMFYYLSKI